MSRRRSRSSRASRRPPGAAGRDGSSARVLEQKLDELLARVAAEPAVDSAAADRAEARVAADVERWMATRALRASAEPAEPRPVASARVRVPRRAALAAVMVFALAGAALYGLTSSGVVLRATGLRAPEASAPGVVQLVSEESWYMQVARAPDTERGAAARDCSGESWYCVEVRPESTSREL